MVTKSEKNIETVKLTSTIWRDDTSAPLSFVVEAIDELGVGIFF